MKELNIFNVCILRLRLCFCADPYVGIYQIAINKIKIENEITRMTDWRVVN